jgi:pre-rRNA-processing protein TSR1
VERFKTSAQFILLPYRELYAALDACKVADYVVFVLSTEVEVDNWGDLALRCLQAQGLPEVITVTQVRATIRSIISIQPIFPSLGKSPAVQEPKQRSAIIKSLLSFIQYFVPTQQRVYDLSSPAEAINAARCFCEGRPNRVRWREGRPWVLVDSLGWEENGSLNIGVSNEVKTLHPFRLVASNSNMSM